MQKWIVLNKIDKIDKKIIENKNFFYVSAKTGKGINKLLNKIHEHITYKTIETKDEIYFFTNERQKNDLNKAFSNLLEASKEKDYEIIAECLRAAS